MRKFKTVEYKVCDALACFIAYGTDDDMTQTEAEEVQEFLNALQNPESPDFPKGCTFGHYSIDSDTSEDFGLCEITNKFANRVKLSVVYWED